jgi:hypothetical protein
VLLLASLTLLTACAATGPGIDACGPWRPILVSRQDDLTRLTAADILAHNETGRRLCGW